MNARISRGDAPLYAVLYSPIDRMEAGPVWGHTIAAAVAGYQYIRADAFLSAMVLVIAVSVVDYVLGIKAAAARGVKWDRRLATSGAYGKISGWILVGLVRMVEHWLELQAILPQTRGLFAAFIAMSLVAIDLQSISKHREEFGARPIPGLAWLLEQFRRLIGSKLPPDPAGSTLSRRPGDPR